MKIYNGYKRLTHNYVLMTDDYEYKMASGYLNSKKEEQEAIFDVFFRKIPNNGGYAIMAGLDKIICFINGLHFDEKELEYFRKNGYDNNFINYLKNFKFTGDIYAIPDGTPIFPNEPILTVKAKISEAQLIETAILSILNGAISHATAARRIVEATPDNVGIMEFGARRADGLEAAIDSSLYAMMVGCNGTSNVEAAHMLNINAMGTMAHSWVSTFDTELDAFIEFAKAYPKNCILLVDTFNTLKSGIPNAIKTFEYMKNNNMCLDHIGIRIDSGDLAYLSKEARKMLNEAGFPQAKICLSNGLKAETIEALINQGACFDTIGVGDNISKPEGNVGCVYKEVALFQNGEYIPKIKISDDTQKIINPGFKKLYRAYDNKTGYALADVMTTNGMSIDQNNLLIVSPTDILKNKVIDDFKLKELQQKIFINGKQVYEDLDIENIKNYCNSEMNKLYPEVRRTIMPHKYYVDGTKEYVNFKYDLINKVKKLTLKD